MIKRVLDVGNCAPDHRAIAQLITRHFPAEVMRVHTAEEAVQALREHDCDLVLVNRKLDRDYSDGIEVVRRIKQDAQLARVPVMMISNFEDHQRQALEAGAEPGFGKRSLSAPETLEKLRPFLDPRDVPSSRE